MEGFLIWGWELILPVFAGTSALAEGQLSPLAARWLHEPQPISNHPVRFGVPHPAGLHTLRGGIDPGDLRFRPRDVGVVEIWRDI